MASRTELLGLYNWDITDQVQTTISNISENFSLLEKRALEMSVNVKDYNIGAKGDYNIANKTGTSDSAAIQKALNLAISQGGVAIFVPDGVYRLTSELVIYKNTKIIMSPNAVLFRDHNGYVFLNGAREDKKTAGYTGNGNLIIQGGTIDANGVVRTGKASIMHIAHAENILFEDVTFKDCSRSHHIEFNSCQNVVVNKCKFLGHVLNADEIFNEAIQLDLPKRNYGSTFGLNDDTPCRNVWIMNSYFGPNPDSSSGDIGRAFGSHAATINRRHENIHFLSNVVENTRSWAVRVYSYQNFNVSNNIFKHCGAGINCRTPILADKADTEDQNGNQTNASQHCYNGMISNNIFHDCGMDGRIIEVYGESSGYYYNVNIVGNSIQNLGNDQSDSVFLNKVRDCTVNGNAMFSPKLSGIVGNSECWGLTIANNTIESPGKHGISLGGSSNYCMIASNAIKRAWNNGIVLEGGNVHVIANNSIGGANGAKGSGDANNHIRIVSSAKRVSVVGNVCRNYSTTHSTTHALYVTSTCEDVSTAGNVFAGFTAYNGATATGTVSSNGDII